MSKINESSKKNISFGLSDIIFALAINKTLNKENITSLIGKMTIIKEIAYINLSNLSKILNCMKMDKLYIFSISPDDASNKFNITTIKEPCLIKYIELGVEDFIKFLNMEKYIFNEYNKHSLYILRNGSYIDIKNILTKINGCDVKLGRGGGQKAHMLSPLDLRFTSYILAMFNFNYELISSLNTFNDLSKDRYLLWYDKSS